MDDTYVGLCFQSALAHWFMEFYWQPLWRKPFLLAISIKRCGCWYRSRQLGGVDKGNWAAVEHEILLVGLPAALSGAGCLCHCRELLTWGTGSFPTLHHHSWRWTCLAFLISLLHTVVSCTTQWTIFLESLISRMLVPFVHKLQESVLWLPQTCLDWLAVPVRFPYIDSINYKETMQMTCKHNTKRPNINAGLYVILYYTSQRNVFVSIGHENTILLSV